MSTPMLITAVIAAAIVFFAVWSALELTTRVHHLTTENQILRDLLRRHTEAAR